MLPLVLAAACGGPTAEAPLTLPLGMSHDATTQALHAHQFCRTSRELPARQELYPRCDRVASEVSQAWVTATFEGDRLVELRRWERFADEAQATTRWNDLVGARLKLGPASASARAELEVRGGVLPGTRSVQAFAGEPGTVVGVYLLNPTPPENARVLERIIYATPPAR